MRAIELKGKYDSAKVFTENIDSVTIGQIIEFLNQPFAKGSHTRIMPDTHAGKGAVIGTTMHVTDKIVPNLVGVDIGCSVLTIELRREDINFEKLDTIIRSSVPSGQSVRGKAHPFNKHILYDNIQAPFDLNRATLSMGTLGGGNHFIEMNASEDGRLFLVIHSGSRHLGVKVATHHQNKAIDRMTNNKAELQTLIEAMKKTGREKEIQQAIQDLKSKAPIIPKELMYLEGRYMDDYINDLRIAQKFAKWNRAAMASTILAEMGLTELGRIDTTHNYLDMEYMILRKGAISARKGEQVLIPINMRDGSILARGKGNDDWNQSAPHGAGRILSRSKAKEQLSLEAYQETMKDVYSTSVTAGTLDESPFAYKTMSEIIANTKDTIDIEAILKPIYNFKAVSDITFGKPLR